MNDGSLDGSLEIVISLTERDHHVVLVDLSCHFGHHKAAMPNVDALLREKEREAAGHRSWPLSSYLAA